jgi:hypothetical protein
MVRHHVANRAGLLVVPGPALNANSFGHRDLHVVHVVAVPDRFEDAIGEAEHQDVLDGFFPKVVVDAVDLIFLEHAVQQLVELLRRFQVVPERFLDDDPRPAGLLSVRARVLQLVQLLDDRAMLAGRR